MEHIHTQQGVGSNPYFTTTKIGIVTGGNGNMEMATVCLSNAVLHVAVFQINGITIERKGKLP